MHVNLLSDETLQHKANQLLYPTRESLKRKILDDIWKAKKATSPKSLFQIISSDAVVDAIRRELKRQTCHAIETDEISRLIRATILRPECMEK